MSILRAVKLILSNIISTFLETVQLEISQLVEELIRKLLMVFYMYRRLWKQTLLGFCPGKILKSLSVLRGDCKCWSIQISNVPLAVATPESTLYQSDKAGLRNCINSLSKSSSHKYPKDTQWVIDGMATFRSVPPSATIRNCSKEL